MFINKVFAIAKLFTNLGTLYEIDENLNYEKIPTNIHISKQIIEIIHN